MGKTERERSWENTPSINGFERPSMNEFDSRENGRDDEAMDVEGIYCYRRVEMKESVYVDEGDYEAAWATIRVKIDAVEITSNGDRRSNEAGESLFQPCWVALLLLRSR